MLWCFYFLKHWQSHVISFFKRFVLLQLGVYMSTCLWVCTGTCRDQKREVGCPAARVAGIFVSCLTWVLGPDLGLPRKQCLLFTTEPTLPTKFLLFYCWKPFSIDSWWSLKLISIHPHPFDHWTFSLLHTVPQAKACYNGPCLIFHKISIITHVWGVSCPGLGSPTPQCVAFISALAFQMFPHTEWCSTGVISVSERCHGKAVRDTDMSQWYWTSCLHA